MHLKEFKDMKGIYQNIGLDDNIGYDSVQQVSKHMVSNINKMFFSAIEGNMKDGGEPKISYEEDGCASFFSIQKLGYEAID